MSWVEVAVCSETGEQQVWKMSVQSSQRPCPRSYLRVQILSVRGEWHIRMHCPEPTEILGQNSGALEKHGQIAK